MRDLQERRHSRHLLQSSVFMLFLLVVVLLLSRSVYGIYKKDQIARINKVESERKLSILKEKEQRLQLEITKLQTSRGIEEELRNKFQITKAGEEVLVVVDDPTTSTESDKISNEDSGLWSKFLKMFGY